MSEAEYINYAVCMLNLQEVAGLTYREARARMIIHVHELEETVAEEWGITVEDVYKLEAAAEDKIASLGMTQKDLFGKYLMAQIYGKLG
ncbi:MAG: hypothetical protein LBG63_02945 [Candidatus Methanoplasma sp.]|nr:hypothetical protein [Candidatus Methanoplasma sp.]